MYAFFGLRRLLRCFLGNGGSEDLGDEEEDS